jgi:hypothetical protein
VLRLIEVGLVALVDEAVARNVRVIGEERRAGARSAKIQMIPVSSTAGLETPRVDSSLGSTMIDAQPEWNLRADPISARPVARQQDQLQWRDGMWFTARDVVFASPNFG